MHWLVEFKCPTRDDKHVLPCWELLLFDARAPDPRRLCPQVLLVVSMTSVNGTDGPAARQNAAGEPGYDRHSMLGNLMEVFTELASSLCCKLEAVQAVKLCLSGSGCHKCLVAYSVKLHRPCWYMSLPKSKEAFWCVQEYEDEADIPLLYFNSIPEAWVSVR